MTNNNKEIKIKSGKSSLSEFVEKKLASDEEVQAFDDYLESEARDEAIEESLTEIYQDDNGQRVNVKKLDVKKERRWLKWLVSLMVGLILLAGAIYTGSYLYLLYGSGTQAVSLGIEGKKQIAAGEEFFYTVSFRNNERVAMKDIEIKLTYPENFVFLASEPAASEANDIWRLAEVGAHRSATIKIKGKLIAEAGTTQILLADARYLPANFSSQFKKSASRETTINDIGLNILASSAASAVVGEESEIIIKYKAKEINYLTNWQLTIDHPDNIELLKTAAAPATNGTTTSNIKQTAANVWQFNQISANEQELKIKFKVKEKKDTSVDLTLRLEQKVSDQAGDKYYQFWSKTLSYETRQSGLNINLIINGSAFNQGIDFGQTLNYSINYANKSEANLKDIIIMAVLEGDLLDSSSLKTASGQVSDNTISWSKNEIPKLALLAPNAEGIIDFSIKIKPASEVSVGSSQIKSYVQFSLAGQEIGANETNRSNIIVNKINSDLSLIEQVCYFNNDNFPIGSGPLPPKVGQTTSLKVYWVISNNLHELADLTVVSQLPSYVSWDDKNSNTAGNLEYDEQNNKVIWQIGRLPLSASNVKAEFNIKITPTSSDLNKILVLLPATLVSAIDSETQTAITKTMTAQTTKLKDDNIANTDGMVE